MTATILHEDDLRSLIARARAPLDFPELCLSDPCAEQLLRHLDAQAALSGRCSFAPEALRRDAVATVALDRIVSDFFQRHPDGMAVSMFPGLCTRFERLDNGAMHWVDVDVPAVARFKQAHGRSSPRRMFAHACSQACQGWVRSLQGAFEVPTLVIGGHRFRHLQHGIVDGVLSQLCQYAPANLELVLEHDAGMPLHSSSGRHGSRQLEFLYGGERNVIRYPRLRFVALEEESSIVRQTLEGVNGVARLFRGRGIPSLAHLRMGA
jgi:O-methyltransferase involved in polyketide biosynthesis